MRKFLGFFALLFVAPIAIAMLRANDPPPWWAYGVPELAPGQTAPPAGGARQGGARAGGARAGGPAGGGAAAPGGGAAGGGGGRNTAPQQAAGSTLQFTSAEINNGFGPADWFPQDHPTMPDVVAHGRHDPDARACALCHLPEGKGRPENAPPAGQSYEYIMQQLTDFRHDLRHSAEPRKTNTNDMVVIAKALTDDQMKETATYFSSMKWTPWIRVVESDTVPKTRLQGNIFYNLGDGTTEPIGNRIIEMPEDNTQAQLRNPRVGFVAYAPVGSVKKGEELAKTGGNGKTTACIVCHGPTLTGVGQIPAIIGRSPSYVVRQLYDFQAGTRNGTLSPLMKPVVEKLDTADMVDLAAYLSSIKPAP